MLLFSIIVFLGNKYLQYHIEFYYVIFIYLHNNKDLNIYYIFKLIYCFSFCYIDNILQIINQIYIIIKPSYFSKFLFLNS